MDRKKINLLKKYISKRYSNNALLVIGIILFNIASIYATQMGVSKAFSSGDFIMANIMPWFFSIGLGLLLIFFSFSILDGSSVFLSSLIYLVLASVSIFFNFNAIYITVSAEPDQEIYNNQTMHRIKVVANYSKVSLNSKKVKLIQEKDTLLASANFEATRPTNPGQGTVYEAKMERYVLLDAKYKPALENIKSQLNAVDKLVREAEKYSDTLSGKNLEKKLMGVLSGLESMGLGDGLGRNNFLEEAINNDISRTSVEYSLSVLIDKFSDLIDGKLGRSDTYRFMFSFVFGAMLDLVIFFALVFNSLRKNRSNKYGASWG